MKLSTFEKASHLFDQRQTAVRSLAILASAKQVSIVPESHFIGVIVDASTIASAIDTAKVKIMSEIRRCNDELRKLGVEIDIEDTDCGERDDEVTEVAA